jgi:hypothetical protein
VSRLSGRVHDSPPGMLRREQGAGSSANSRRTDMNIAIMRGAADRGHRVIGVKEFADEPPRWRASMRVAGSPDDEAKQLGASINRVRSRLLWRPASAASHTGTGPRALRRHRLGRHALWRGLQ